MINLRIAAAQSSSLPLNIVGNVARHLEFIDAAHANEVELLVFPELSLTGYEPAGVGECALTATDERLASLGERAQRYGMCIVVGAPVANPTGLPSIGAITFHADGRHSVYRKRFLFTGEDQFAAAGNAISQVHDLRGSKVALAICFDISQTQHPHAASINGAELYAAGSFLTPQGYAKDAGLLAGYASLYGMDVLMANHAGPTGGYESAGGSAIWAAGGELLVASPCPGECLVIADRRGGTVLPL